MKGSVTLDDAIAELRAWYHGERVGTLHVEFGPGVIHRLTREERVTAPPADSRKGLRCPQGHDALEEQDYGARYRCGTCAVTYSVWNLRERRG